MLFSGKDLSASCWCPSTSHHGQLVRTYCPPACTADHLTSVGVPLATDHGDDHAGAVVLESSVISGSKSSYEFFRCELGLRLGSEVIRRHDAAHPLATAALANPLVRDNGRAPVPGLRRYV